MTFGIGTRQDTGRVEFCDGRKSVPIKNDNISKRLVPTWSSAMDAQLDYDEFLSKFGVSDSITHIEQEAHFEEDDAGAGEEEVEELLRDEFNLNLDLNEDNKQNT
jgi:hypothetical protein